MKKITFDEYVQNISEKSNYSFSDNTWNVLRTAYDLHVPLAQFFGSSYNGTDFDIEKSINSKLRKLYKIQFHNIGKNPFQRYFASEDHYPWLKLEQYLISHFYSIQKDETSISNKSIAIKLGWLSDKEINPDTIAKAVRKVADNLFILKNDDRKTISVEQRHIHGKNGSYHVITANWINIIPLYQSYDPNKAMSIRMRKRIRYRIISLIYHTIKSFSQGLASLMKLQKKKYLNNLVTMDLDKFKDDRFYWRHLLEKIVGAHPDWMDQLDTIIPDYQHPDLKLTIKNEVAYKFLTNPIYKKQMNEQYQIQLTIVPMF